MIVYVLVGIWQGTLDLVVYTDKVRAEKAKNNLSKKYGKLGNVIVEEKEVVE